MKKLAKKDLDENNFFGHPISLVIIRWDTMNIYPSSHVPANNNNTVVPNKSFSFKFYKILEVDLKALNEIFSVNLAWNY